MFRFLVESKIVRLAVLSGLLLPALLPARLLLVVAVVADDRLAGRAAVQVTGAPVGLRLGQRGAGAALVEGALEGAAARTDMPHGPKARSGGHGLDGRALGGRAFAAAVLREEHVDRGHDEQREEGAEQQAADDDPADLLAALGAGTTG